MTCRERCGLLGAVLLTAALVFALTGCAVCQTWPTLRCVEIQE